jgi:hypothetical protein
MKNLKIIIVLIISLAINARINGQFTKVVRGNHKVTTQERKTESFSGIKVSTGVDVYLKQGEADGTLKVEADENLQEYILTEVRNGILNVYTEVNIREAERKRVYVTMKEVTSIGATSAGDVIGESPIKTDNIKLSASSAGDIKLEIYAKDIKIDISSSGDMTLTGETEWLKADLSSAGDLNAYELKVREADISASSAGDADVTVTERITARASSAGDINYRGQPKYVDAHSSSAGGVHSR